MERPHESAVAMARMLKLEALFDRAMAALEHTLPMAVASPALNSDSAVKLHSLDLDELFRMWALMRSSKTGGGRQRRRPRPLPEVQQQQQPPATAAAPATCPPAAVAALLLAAAPLDLCRPGLPPPPPKPPTAAAEGPLFKRPRTDAGPDAAALARVSPFCAAAPSRLA